MQEKMHLPFTLCPVSYVSIYCGIIARSHSTGARDEGGLGIGNVTRHIVGTSNSSYSKSLNISKFQYVFILFTLYASLEYS